MVQAPSNWLRTEQPVKDWVWVPGPFVEGTRPRQERVLVPEVLFEANRGGPSVPQIIVQCANMVNATGHLRVHFVVGNRA